jgi:hypothetical protein
MKSLKIIAALVLTTSLAVARAAGPAIESGTAVCEPVGAGSPACNLRWDLSATPRAAYVIEWLNPETGQWEPATGRSFASPYTTAHGVAAGRLYRVLGCDDPGRRKHCVSTTAFWAPVMPKDGEIPDSVPIGIVDGELEHAAISKDAQRYTQIMQLNVYLLTNVLGHSASADLPPMSAPREPGAPGDMAHDVHHNVYEAYEAERNGRYRRQLAADANR